MMITFAEMCDNKSIKYYFAENSAIRHVLNEIKQKKLEISEINPRFIKKISEKEEELSILRKRLRRLLDLAAKPSVNMTFKKLIATRDSFEKYKVLEKKLNNYKGNKQLKSYKNGLSEFKRLQKMRDKLIADKKKRVANTWKIQEKKIETEDSEIVKVDLAILDVKIRNMYNMLTSTRAFKAECKKLKKVLGLILPYIKAQNPKAFKKYYSVYIDVCEALK